MNILKKPFIFLIVLMVFSGCGFDRDPSYIRMSDRIVDKYLNDMKAQHGLYCFGRGGGFLEKINEVIIDFEAQGLKSQDEMRDLLITITEDLLQRFNENEEIRPYLKNYPFTPKNISIGILLTDENGISFFDKEFDKEEIRIIDQLYGDIVYKVNIAEIPYTREVFRETYEEALDIVKDRNPELFTK